MPLKFENGAEAFLAVLALALGADSVGSLKERDFLFEKVKPLPIFGNPSSQAFSQLLGKITDAVYTELPTEEGAISAAGVDQLLTEAKKILSPELSKTLIATAAELLKSDGSDEAERVLLAKIERVLG
ncbi:MAG TPA: hypothetical protein VHM70_32420 [Polyangiaceae bacterium]|jgi:hypothetical protein|nr:hypothetical protein [Polyangiaceae bacterium]